MNDLLGVIRRRLPLVILCGLIAFAVPTVLAVTSPDSYRATSRLFVATSAQDVTAANQGNLAAQSRARTYALMATGPELLIRAAQRSGISITGDELAKRVTVSAPPDTVLLDVAATASSAQEAAELSDAVAQELVALVQTAEKPLRGGQPSLGLLILQPADAGATKVPAFKPITVGAFTVGGLIIGGVIALLIPARFRPFRRRGRRDTAAEVTATETPTPAPTSTAEPREPRSGRPVDDDRTTTFDSPDTADSPDPSVERHNLDRSPRPGGTGSLSSGPAYETRAQPGWETVTDPGTRRSDMAPRPPQAQSRANGAQSNDGETWSFRDRFPAAADGPRRGRDVADPSARNGTHSR